MRKVILKYKIFESSKEFEEWQESNDIVIHHAIPCATSIDTRFSNSLITEQIPEFTQGFFMTGIFVVYHVGELDEIPS